MKAHDLSHACLVFYSTQLSMTAEGVSRTSFLKNTFAAAATFTVAAPAFAEIDNPVVPLLGGGDKVRPWSDGRMDWMPMLLAVTLSASLPPSLPL
jgi:hypothetical protein